MQTIQLDQTNQSAAIKAAVKTLAQGGLVIYPTETVYGIGADATNQEAVDKLLAYKSRREGKPLSIAVTDLKMASQYVELNDQAKQIYQKFLPGPVTVVSKAKNNTAKGVASEFNTLGIRIPDHPLILKIVEQFGKPITSTSANASGKKRPYQISDILDNLSQTQKDKLDLILDAGTLPPQEPSTVIDTTTSTPLTVRGKSTQADLELISHSSEETKQIAGKIMLKNWNQLKENGLIIGLNGRLGAGKTIFSKGVAEFLQIKEVITSPTYTYIKEYPFSRHQTQGIFYHLDMWRLDTKQELETFELKKLIKPNSVLAIEWWSQVAAFFPKTQAKIITINLAVKDADTRKLKIDL